MSGELGAVLSRLAGERPNLTLLAGEDLGGADAFAGVEAFAETWPDRLLTLAPAQARLAVAEGIARAGGSPLVLAEPSVGLADVPDIPGLVIVAADIRQVAVAARAGIWTCLPGWTADLPAALVGAMSDDHTVVLYAGAGLRTAPPPTPMVFGEHRVLCKGPDGLVLGGGPGASVAKVVGELLAAGRRRVTALDTHTLDPASGVAPDLLIDHLLVGPLDSPRAAALTAIPIGDDLSVLASRCLQELRRTVAR